MRYLGGKTQISRELADIVNKYRNKGQAFIDPFCGSLAMGIALGGLGICSDIHTALINMYLAIRSGWRPPSELSRQTWDEAKLLPDTNPLKAFAGFGCSFRGLYFSSYAGGYVGPVSRHGAIAAKTVLERDVAKLVARNVLIEQSDFLTRPVCSGKLLYLDPPYKGVTEYADTPTFDYDRFYSRVKLWSKYNTVLVSEYDFPFGEVVWEKSRARKLIAGSGKRAVEKLFYIRLSK